MILIPNWFFGTGIETKTESKAKAKTENGSRSFALFCSAPLFQPPSTTTHHHSNFIRLHSYVQMYRCMVVDVGCKNIGLFLKFSLAL